MLNREKVYKSHGDGTFSLHQFKSIGEGVLFETGVLVFHPETIEIQDHVYVGHNTILKGYYKGFLSIGEQTWIGQNCFFHSAAGLTIGRAVGIGPGVSILTSSHSILPAEQPVIYNDLQFAAVTIADGADIGVGSIILPGVSIGEGAIIGAGSVVTRNVDPYAIVAGNPARLLRFRTDQKKI